MILQLNPPLPMDTAHGPGLAHFMIDYGPEEHLMWVVFLDADGACWTVPNPEVRMQANWSLGRRPSSRPLGKAPPAPIVAPPAEAPGAFAGVPTIPATNGHAAPTVLNGHPGDCPGGHAGALAPRYDALPAA